MLEYAADYPSRWMDCQSISAKIGCPTHTLLDWVKRPEVDSGKRAGGVGVDLSIAKLTSFLKRSKRIHRELMP